jgi:hypothetical protein
MLPRLVILPSEFDNPLHRDAFRYGLGFFG